MSLDLIRTFLLKSKASNRRSFLSDLFKTMDKDRSKRIDYAEFKNGLKALGLIDITDNEFRKLFIEFDSVIRLVFFINQISFNDVVLILRIEQRRRDQSGRVLEGSQARPHTDSDTCDRRRL